MFASSQSKAKRFALKTLERVRAKSPVFRRWTKVTQAKQEIEAFDEYKKKVRECQNITEAKSLFADLRRRVAQQETRV